MPRYNGVIHHSYETADIVIDAGVHWMYLQKFIFSQKKKDFNKS